MKAPTTLTGASACRLWLITVATTLALGGSTLLCWSALSNETDQAAASSSVPWQENQIIHPPALAKTLSATTARKPLVICVGFRVLYDGGHIVGARFAGPASRPAGIQTLKHTVKDLPRNKPIVLYCGCCPWNRCPNIRPAFRTMKKLGFTHVKVLSIPTNFRKDWIAKGYPIKKGASQQ